MSEFNGIYVDATIYSWELNTIKKAILDGRIAFVDSQAASRLLYACQALQEVFRGDLDDQTNTLITQMAEAAVRLETQSTKPSKEGSQSRDMNEHPTTHSPS